MNFPNFFPKSYQLKAKSCPGFSMIIALGLVSLMTILMVGLYTQSLENLRYSTNTKNATAAYYYASAALQQAQLAANSHAAGYAETSNLGVGIEMNGDSLNDAYWKLYGKSGQLTDGTGKYIIPYPGSGTAGENCSLLKAPSGSKQADDGCNWDRLYIGEQVSIPLYVETPTGTCAIGGGVLDTTTGKIICNPKQLNLNNLYIRIRTQCLDSPNCSTSKDLDASGDPENDSTIVHWEITGEDGTNPGTSAYTLQAITKTDSNGNKLSPPNSEIYESLINDAKNNTQTYIVQLQSYCGKDINNHKGHILDFLKDIANNNSDVNCKDSTNNWGTQTILKPILKLTIIHSLCANADCSSSIPYLEYQIMTDVPIANAKKIITAEGKSQNFVQRIRKDVPQAEGSVLNFVISD